MCKFQALGKSAIVILIWNGFPALATVYDPDGSSTNVQYVHDNLAVVGDTIAIPAGTFTWSTKVTIAKAITLQGAGYRADHHQRQRTKHAAYPVDARGWTTVKIDRDRISEGRAH
jgi:hypothetical protein